MIKVLDDFLPKEYVDNLENLFLYHKEGCVSEINWHYNGWTVDQTDFYYNEMKNNKNLKDTFQFTHNFFSNNKIQSTHFKKIIKILEDSKIKYSQIERIKANFTTNINKFKKSDLIVPHTDTNDEQKGVYVSMVYYVHNTDGDTLFFSNDRKKLIKKISPKKGRAVIFFSDQVHSFQNPIKSDKRIVINFVVKLKDE